MRPIDLQCDGVSKRYALRRADARPWWRGPGGVSETVWAVRDVSFEVPRGETFGIIGHNGAGKSTLLKLLTGITAPSIGTITIRGRVAALIEVGSGFHPELSGRENVFLTGAILGMRRREIAAKLESIVEFAGVRPFIDMPVKWYSSGMYVRLGFAIAAHLEPHVLLVDEVLAVGDAAFQARCLERIEQLRRAGTTLVFISHDLQTVVRVCDRVGVMHGGRLVAVGDPADMVRTYLRVAGLDGPSEPATAGVGDTASLLPSPPLVDETIGCGTGRPFRISVQYVAPGGLAGTELSLGLYSAEGHVLHVEFTTARGDGTALLSAGTHHVQFDCPALGLQPGDYVARATLRDAETDRVRATSPDAAVSVAPGVSARGHFYMPHEWRTLEGV